MGDGSYCCNDHNTGSTPPRLPPWKDAASLLGAEQALEFWANRNKINTNAHKNNIRHLNNQSTAQLEEDADTAHRLFAGLEHIHTCTDDGRGTDFILTNGMYSYAIDALAKSPKLEHVQLADAYLRMLIELYLLHNMQNSLACQPSVMQLLDQIRGAPHQLATNTTTPMDEDNESSTTTQSKITVQSSRRFVRAIRWNKYDDHRLPNHIRITGVMRGYARQSKPKAAEALLNLMIELSSCPTLCRQQYMQIFRTNAVGYATVIDAYSRMHDAVNAERILRLMGFATNVVAYNATISAWARCAKKLIGDGGTKLSPKPVPNEATISSSRRAAENAERLLREMWNGGLGDNNNNEESRNKSLNGNPLLPDVVTYSTVISAFATCMDQPYGLKRAHELLNELEGLATQEFEETQSATMSEGPNLSPSISGRGRNPHGFQPNELVYNPIIHAYANAGDAKSAEAMLESLISLHMSSLKNGGGGPFQHVRPNIRTFNVVLNAVAKGDGIDAGPRARKILERLESTVESRSGNDGLRPDIITFNSVLSAWSKSASVEPNSSESNSEVVGKYAAYEALKLLDQIEERHMKSLDGKHTNKRSHVVKPDVFSYNTTIHAFANAAQHGEDGIVMAEKAEDILNRMVTMGIQPNSISYNVVLLAWSRSSGGMMAAKHAESILRSMKEPSPTVISWSTVVNAYANADGAQMAEALLREMEDNVVASSLSPQDRSNQGARTLPIIPSIYLYNNVLLSWQRSSNVNASRNAELLFNRMHDLPHLPSPDAISYRIVLTALENTLDCDKAERAQSFLYRLLATNESKSLFKPQEILNAFNSVLTACAYTPSDAGEHHRRNAARILVETLRDMNHYAWEDDRKGGGGSCGPNQETYAHFIQGCIHLFDPKSGERNALLELAFRECCNRGLLSRSIWDKFCIAIGPRAAREFLGEGISQFDEFPEEWCNKGPK
ncbi:hypothetical protein ACHAWU_009647 [Discostella pseudostelligera]|uniref:Pentacotripeptide-repeat region of PRORP domain-containing protein n=1 Tax=Discostella pseudostelligera TaxID=259834 RepID=A0ABD3MAJ1_9STRA